MEKLVGVDHRFGAVVAPSGRAAYCSLGAVRLMLLRCSMIFDNGFGQR
jgi:hypothetical protein